MYTLKCEKVVRMKISFVIDAQRHLKPNTLDDKKRLDLLREKAKEGDVWIFEAFRDRSTAQQRMYRAICNYMIYASEDVQKKHGNAENFHNSCRWEFCLMRPEFFISTKVYIDGNITLAKVPFSTSPHDGIDAAGMNEYMEWFIHSCAKVLGIPPERLKIESEKLRQGVHE